MRRAKARLGKGSIGDIQYSPDGTRLAVSSDIGIWFYDTQTYQEVALLTGYTNRFRKIAFSPDGQMLAATVSRSRSWDDIIYVWDVATSAHRYTLTGHSSAVVSIAFSSDGQMLASGSQDDTIRLWDAVTGKHKHTCSPDTRGLSKVSHSVLMGEHWRLVEGGEVLSSDYGMSPQVPPSECSLGIQRGSQALHSARMGRPYPS